MLVFFDFAKLLKESLSVENDFDSWEGLLTGEDKFFGAGSNIALVGLFDSRFVIFLDSDELLLIGWFSSFSESVLLLLRNGDDRRTTLDALPSVSTKPSAAVFCPAGDSDRGLGIHDLRLNLADKRLEDSVGSSKTSSPSAETGVLNMGVVIACSVLLPCCIGFSAVSIRGRFNRRFSAGDLLLRASMEDAASDSGVVSPDESIQTSSVLLSSIDEESRVPSLLVESDCVSCVTEVKSL
jgi:hypothetical protein